MPIDTVSIHLTLTLHSVPPPNLKAARHQLLMGRRGCVLSRGELPDGFQQTDIVTKLSQYTAARLNFLTGKLAVYNGRLVRNPIPLGRGQVIVAVPPNKKDLERGNTAPIELEINQKYLVKVLDREQIEKEKQSQLKQNAAIGKDLVFGAGLRHKFVALMSQIRAACRTAQKRAAGDDERFEDDIYDSLREIFAKFDVNGNGYIAKNEFLIACLTMGVSVTEAEVEQLWPLFDIDKSGELDVEEFINCIQQTDVSSRGEFYRTREQQHGHCVTIGAEMRRKRIKTKSTMADTLTHAVIKLTNAIRSYMKHQVRLDMQSRTFPMI